MSDGNNLNRVDETRLRSIFNPERVGRLMQIVGPHFAGARRSVLHLMPLAWRIGHIAMEPHALWELYGATHDRIVLLFPDSRIAPHSRGMRTLIDPYFRILETDEKGILIMGHVDAGILSQDSFTWYQRGPTGVLDDYIAVLSTTGRRPRHFALPDELADAAGGFCERLGIAEDDRIVVLNVRDRHYMADQPVHFYRAAEIESYGPAIRHLLDKGYWVLRIGVEGSVPAGIEDPRYVEVWNEPDYSDLLDPGLIARARFGVTCSSGPEAVFRVLGVPQMMVNGVLQCSMWLNPEDRLLFKSYRSASDGRPARLGAMLEQGVATHADAEKIRASGYTVKDNTPEEILAAVAEMDAALEPAAADPGPDGRFLQIGADYQTFLSEIGHPPDPQSLSARAKRFGYALPWTRVADANASPNPAFLE